MCLRCKCRPAESRAVSLFRLCEPCAIAVCPGPDVQEYRRLRNLYGY